jgi:hypothetical protein
MDGKFPKIIVYDIKSKQAGCALIQASHGGTIDNFSLQFFNNWLTFPTEDLRRVLIKNQEELDLLIEINNSKHKTF